MRKKFMLMTVLLSVMVTGLLAQANIVVNEVLAIMSKGQQTGFEVIIPEADKKSVDDNWGKLMKRYKAKVITSKKSVEMFSDNAMIPVVSENTVDIYSISQQLANGVQFVVFVDLGGAFVSSAQYSLAFNAFEAVLRQFAIDELKRTVDRQIDKEDKALKALEKELGSLLKEKENHIKEIERCRAIIAQREQDIVTNDNNQATKNQQIELQRMILSTVQQKRTTLGK
jgi:hypothetical protein